MYEVRGCKKGLDLLLALFKGGGRRGGVAGGGAGRMEGEEGQEGRGANPLLHK